MLIYDTESDIVFPTDDGPEFNLRIGMEPIPRCRPGETFCSNVDNYPEDYLRNVLRAEGHQFDGLFGDDVVLTDTVNLTQRIDLPGEQSLCDSRETVIYPKVGLNSNETWRYIVNSGNYTQGIRIETCVK